MTLHRRLLRLAGPFRGPLAVTVLVGLAITGTQLAQAFAAATVLARLFGGATFADVVVPLVVMAGIIALRAGLVLGRELAARRTGAVVTAGMRTRLLDQVAALGPGHLARERSGTAASTVVDGVDGLEAYYSRYLPQVVVAAVTVLTVCGWLASRDVVVAATVAAVALAIPVVPRLWDRALTARGHDHWAAYADLNAEYVDAMQGMTTLKTFDTAVVRRDALEGKAWHLYRSTMRSMRISLVETGLTAFGQSLGVAAATAVAAGRVATGALPATDLFFVLLLAIACFRPFRELTMYWHAGYLGVSAAERIGELYATVPEVTERPDAREFTRRAGPPAIAFEEVTFAYAAREQPALADVSFTVGPGETVALTGRSGAGKTTAVSLLLRFFDPRSGHITLDGVDIAALTLTSLRRQISVVSQDTYLFHGTVADNLRLAHPGASDADLVDAARAASAHEFVADLPDGYATVIGERGLTLSGGQRQRLSIARALLADRPVLVLDEATSSIDADSEKTIAEAMRRLSAGRTTLVIAHRLSTIRDADRIVVLDDGRVAETGGHDELVTRGGRYADLIAAQRVAVGSGAAR
ncbi:ABC transporter ATP-binding protein [Frankia sp. CN7]|nr:ABC transporter ATP-binding protein [Frankia nepalensis]